MATVTSDDPALQPLIVNGKSLKSVNHLYNKRLAVLNAVYSKNGIHTGRKLRQLNMKRQLIMNDYMHKSSRRVVDYCILNNVKSVYIGHNDGWK